MSLRIETDAAMCRCGAVWLTPWQPTFLAEGAGHGRTRCWPVAAEDIEDWIGAEVLDMQERYTAECERLGIPVPTIVVEWGAS